MLQSFLNLTAWLDLVKGSSQDKLPYAAVIANKSDLKEQRAVAAADHNSFVKENGLYR